MLVSLNWLKDLVDIDVSLKELDDVLTNAGTKVETITPLNENAKNIVAGRIKKIEKHPNADRLLVCETDIGKDEPVTIVTSATNVFENALVPVAINGSVIADGTEIKKTKFRGIESEGMFCSVAELGMPKDLFQKEILDGIYILPEDFVEPGDDLIKKLWVDDQIIDIELTANRGDCQSVLGIAKETAASFNLSYRPIDYSIEEGTEDISNYLDVEVESDFCPRYTARMFKVNEIKPSPMWMQLRLLNSGVRPINNIVDVTNYVMLELGQPLHAFDYASIGSDKIVVKTNNKEKTVTTLDGTERQINEDMLMITNGKYPIAVAGVMGGLNSEITEDTELVVLESANFDKTSIRLTSRDLGLRTESSSRYEKGINSELAGQASQRAAHLFNAIGAATPINGFIDIQRLDVNEDIDIPLNIDWLNGFLGTELTFQEVRDYLNRLFLGTSQIGENELLVRIPEYRQDLRLKEDLAEEVARLYGYNNIPSTIMKGETFVGEKSDEQLLKRELEDLLIGLGHYQTMTTSFTSPNQIANLSRNPNEDRVEIINPLGEESSLMRNTLIPQQLELISINNNRGNDKGQFFEIQKTYHEPEKGELPIEKNFIVISEYGTDADFYDLKGKVEAILNRSGITDYKFIPNGSETFHPGKKAQVVLGKTILGELGEIHPEVVKKYNLPKKVYLAELSFDEIFKNSNKQIQYKDLPRFPEITRDLALIVDNDIEADKLKQIIVDNAGENFESIDLFDVYTGDQIPAGKKSLAYTITFRSPNRTLVEDEVNPVIDTILEKLKKELNAELRS